MYSFRLTREHNGFIAQQMGKALPSEALQSGIDGHRRFESDRCGIHRLWQASGSEKSIASLGLATRLDADWSGFQQPPRRRKESRRIAVLELELDLADRFHATTICGANFALLDRGLNSRGRIRLHFDHSPRDRRLEDRTQIMPTNGVGQSLAGLRRVNIRPLAGDRIFPLTARQQARPR